MIGDIVLVRPGERISADATGMAAAKRRSATVGERCPSTSQSAIRCSPALSRHSLGAPRTRSTASRGPVVARIATLAEASQTKARTQLFIEKVEQRYSIGMVADPRRIAVPPAMGETLQRECCEP